MKEARITINLSEYEGFKRTIQNKDKYITQCVNNGKIKRNDIFNTIFYKYLDPYSFHPVIRLLSEDYKEYLTKSQLKEIKNKKLKEAITDILKYKKEWEDDFNLKVKTISEDRIDIENKSWLDRLSYLFTGKLS